LDFVLIGCVRHWGHVKFIIIWEAMEVQTNEMDAQLYRRKYTYFLNIMLTDTPLSHLHLKDKLVMVSYISAFHPWFSKTLVT